jgi:release factor glutamine methyltransferase
LTITEAITALRQAGCVFAEEEAALLAAAADDETALATMVARRADGEPLEQVVGYADFCGVRVRLRPGVFVPRVRSQFLVRTAVQNTRPHATVVDLCCGSGALGLAVRAQVPTITLHAADIDPQATACARDNLPAGDVHEGDLFNALPEQLKGNVDILLANVPYVASRHLPFLPAEARDHEPPVALDGGPDGLDVFRRVLKEVVNWLSPGGLLLSEITEAQIDAATTAITGAGLEASTAHEEELEATVVTARRRIDALR